MRVYPLFARAVVAGALVVAGAAAHSNEDIFKTALQYTVQVRATVPVPTDGSSARPTGRHEPGSETSCTWK